MDENGTGPDTVHQPWLIGFLAFTLYPSSPASLVYNIAQPPVWLGAVLEGIATTGGMN